MAQLNFAIIGYGKMGQIRHKTLQDFDGCKVTWVCDIHEPKGLEKEIKFTNDAAAIFADPNVDAIIVSPPNFMIKDCVVRALHAGKHVFSEKPPGRNIFELNEMISAEKSNPGVKLMFGFNHRHHESIIKTKELIDSGEYGRILWLRGRYGKSVDENFFNTWRAKKDLAGGGILLDQGIHMLDLFLMLCGDFDEVKAYVSNIYWHLDIEDNVFGIFRNTKTGLVASIHSTMTQWRHIFSLEIFLEKGYITINGLKTSTNSYGDEVMSIAKNRTLPPQASWTDEEKLVFHVDTSWNRELGIFLNCIQENKPVPMGNSQDALKVMDLVTRVYQND